ncbi:MAG TPA: hypothetical protein VLA96_04610 [Terriglobales bacterium]|jgi:hypothetical protein|nr:hypothetical protein [Terriglobales bacterium]
MQNTTQTRRLTILGVVLLLAAAGAASGPAKSAPTAWGYDFHAVVPLGYDTLRLEPAKKVVCLLASAEAIGFEGLQRREDNGRVLVTSASGEPVKHYPEVIDFRVTASARKKKLADRDDAPYPVHAEQPVNDYLLRLKFRLVIFHGLEARVLEPAAVRLIGVPADVPYDERVYRVSFNVGKVAVEDRMVLEVLDPDGNRVSKFPLIVG